MTPNFKTPGNHRASRNHDRFGPRNEVNPSRLCSWAVIPAIQILVQCVAVRNADAEESDSKSLETPLRRSKKTEVL